MVSNPAQYAHSKIMVVSWQTRCSVTHTDVVHYRSLQLKGQTLMGTCHWCRLGTYQGISTRRIHPPSSATCRVCCTSSAAVTHWNTWSTTHSWPRKSYSYNHFHLNQFECALVGCYRGPANHELKSDEEKGHGRTFNKNFKKVLLCVFWLYERGVDLSNFLRLYFLYYANWVHKKERPAI